jgi:hypothetical protein
MISRDPILEFDFGTLPDTHPDPTCSTFDTTRHGSRQCLDAFNFNTTNELLPRSVSGPTQPLDSSLQSSDIHRPGAINTINSHISSHEMMAHDILLNSHYWPPSGQQGHEGPFFQVHTHQPTLLQSGNHNTGLAFSSYFHTTAQSSSVFETIEQVLSIYVSQKKQPTDVMWKPLLTAAVRLLLSWTSVEEFAHCLVRTSTTFHPKGLLKYTPGLRESPRICL